MKRLHVHVSVRDLDVSKRFYSSLFGTAPSVEKPDYAKWMLEDPRVNFAISTRNPTTTGVDHLGIQVDSREELDALAERLRAADASLQPEENTTCCYAQSDKNWVPDPQGVSWETFYSHGESTVYGGAGDTPRPETSEGGACCGPRAA